MVPWLLAATITLLFARVTSIESSYEFQDFDGPLAVGGHHHVAVCLPANCRDEFIDVFLLTVAVQEGAHRVELELEEVLGQALRMY